MERVCEFEECGILFTAKTHNQKYCCDEHRNRATNRRIMARYYESKARRGGAHRVCSTPGCATRLSRYNPSRVCAKCEAEIQAAEKARLRSLFS